MSYFYPPKFKLNIYKPTVEIANIMTNNSFITNLTVGIQKRIESLWYNPYKKVNISWFKLKYYKHLTSGKLRVHKLFGQKLHYYSPTELLHGLHEIFIENIYKLTLDSTPYILDCGANIGLSVIYLKRAYPNATVVAFEPDEINFSLLAKNVDSFKLSGVELCNEAVWKENTTLHFSNQGSMGSKIEIGNEANTREVKAVRLRDFINRKIDFLKIDIEGAEYEVLMDIADNLSLVNNMFLEYHGKFEQNAELSEIIKVVTSAGFNFYIKEAAMIYSTPFARQKNPHTDYDIQLNIFCFRS